MNQIELIDKENNSFIANQNIKKRIYLKEKNHIYFFQNLLSKIKLSNTINSKKNIIDKLITTIQHNNDIFKLKETNQILIHIYKLIQVSITDNTILFILSQLSLISLFIDNLYQEKTFILFFKRILPKLFDKFYLHNDNINKSLLSLFIKSIIKKVLVISDYYDYIENITLEDDSNYILNVLNFFYSCIKIDNNLTIEVIPENIINIIKHINDEQKNVNDNNNDLNIYEICWKILSLLNNRNNKKDNIKLVSISSAKKKVKPIKENGLSSSQQDESFIHYNNRANIYNNDNDDIFQILITNNNDFNDINKEESNLNNEIIYIEGENSIIESQNNKKKKIDKSKLRLDNSYSTHIFTNLGVSTIGRQQDSDMDDNQNIFTLSNTNIDNLSEETFQKTPMFNYFDGSGRLIKKNLSNSEKNIEGIKPINLHEKFDIHKTNEINGKEKQFENIKFILGKDIINSLNSQKWEIKKYGYKLIYQLIKNNVKNIFSNNNNINDLIEYLKIKHNIFHENNFNVIIEIINMFNYLISNNFITKEQMILILSNYYDRIYDIKLKQYIIDLIDLIITKLGINIVIKQIISKLNDNKNNKLLNEYSNYFITIINDNNINNIPTQDLMEYTLNMLNNQNMQVRQSGINLLCNIYKYIGNNVNIFLKDIKEPILKIIYKELNKIKVIKNHNNKNKFSNINVTNNNNEIIKRHCSKNNKDNVSNLPIDISEKIDEKILKNISSRKWAETKNAYDAILKILNDSYMNILPNGLNDLFSIINNNIVINDTNKNNIKILFINLLSKLIEALKNNFKIFSSEIAVNLIHNLSDKNENIRKEILLCFEKWVNFVGIDSLIIYFPPFLKNENIEIRLEILNFILKYNTKISESISRIIYKEMANNLLLYLQDKNKSIRYKAEEIIKLSLKYISIDNYYKIVNNFKPKIAKDICRILNKINKKQEKNLTIENTFRNKKSLYNKKMSLTSRYIENYDNNYYAISKKSSFISNGDCKDFDYNNLYTKDSNNKIFNSNKFSLNNSYISLSIKNSFSTKSSKSKTKPINTHRQVLYSNIGSLILDLNKSKIRKNITTQNSQNDLNNKNKSKNKNKSIFNINYKINQKKEQRYNLDKKNIFDIYKITKEEYNKIKELSKNIFINNFIKKLFNNDLKVEISAYQILQNQLKQKNNFLKVFDNLDIILKIIGYRIINNTNTSLIKNILEFLDSLYLHINKYNFILNDIEYNIIFCILIEKLCINNNILKEKIISLINNYIHLCGPNRIMPTLINISINQNNKVKTEILDIIINLYKSQDLNIYSNNFILLLNKIFISNGDKFVKNKCLYLFKEIYTVQGKNLWNQVTFEDKIKRLIIEQKSNDNNIKERNSSNIKIYRNKSYKETNISKKYNTISNNKNKENEIFYNTEINFNSKINHPKPLELNYSNEKKCNSKIKVKKMEKNKTILQKLNILNLKKNYKTINNSLNNSFNSKENSFCGYSNDSDNYYYNNKYNDIFNNKNNVLTKEELIIKMNNLLSDNYLIKINTIIILHEILCVKYEQNKIIILNNIDQIIDIFIKIIKDLFYYIENYNNHLESNLNTNFIKFTKYIVTTLCKLLSNKELILNVSYRTIYNLSEELISCLIINEDLIKGNDNNNKQEKNIIFKSLNSSMMRILDNYNTTSILLILIELISNYYNKNIHNYNVFISTIINCLEKKTQNIETIISDIQIDAILLQVHLLLNKLNEYLSDLKPKNDIDNMIISFIKKFMYAIICYKKEKILYDYNKSVRCHFLNDKYIINWINDLLHLNEDKKIKDNKKYNNKLYNLKKSDNNYNNSISNFKKTNGKLVTSFSNKIIFKNKK